MDISFYLKKRNCRIAVPHGAQRKIAERFGVSKQLVSYALRQVRNSKRAREIRKAAMEEFGGREEKLKNSWQAKRAEDTIKKIEELKSLDSIL